MWYYISMNNLKKTIGKWLTCDNEREVLARFYLFVGLAAFALASVVSLADDNFGRNILMISVVSLAIYAANWTVWIIGSALKREFFPEKPASKRTSKK